MDDANNAATAATAADADNAATDAGVIVNGTVTATEAVDAPVPAPVDFEPTSGPAPDSIEGRLIAVEARVAALEEALAVEHSALPDTTLSAKVTWLLDKICGTGD